jgi:2-amino-4-hydroxy-6-hydroxymethyldihydropteridine diphosphokinase
MTLLGLGSNQEGNQGPPEAMLRWALGRLPQFGVRVNDISTFSHTSPMGVPGQPVYINAVARVSTSLSPRNLLRVLKTLEREAGRDQARLQTRRRWDRRPLDLDIIDYEGRVIDDHAGGRSSRLSYPLVLPHPFAHLRPFVIGPLREVAPWWHHPVSHRSVDQLWVRLARREEGRILDRHAGSDGIVARVPSLPAANTLTK